MSLICLSYAHQHTSIGFREQVYFDADSAANACARFRCGNREASSLLEFVLLSTCNRTEIYGFSRAGDSIQAIEQVKSELLDFVKQSRQVDREQLVALAEWKVGPEVAQHLTRVSCGLESLVLGEPQILGQVGDAMQLGLIMNSSGTVLTNLFQAAIRAGRRARTETQINHHSMNISTVAVNTAERQLGSLKDKTVVVLGAGEMAELALAQLKKKGVSDFRIVNRTIARAAELANEYDGQACVFEQISHLLPKADILITSTGAPHTLITSEMITFAMQARASRPMTILDIAVPRDVETSVENVANVTRCDIDDLQMAAAQSASLRQKQVPAVEQIVQMEMDRFLAWFRGIGAEDTIIRLRQKADEIRSHELSRLANMLPNLDDEAWHILERFADSLVNKILHDPTTKLRELEGTRDALDHGEAIRQLFCLEERSKLVVDKAAGQ
ncbi:MAG: glutamyl-tRNA reductase [Pirellulaceae bacterium]|nr:glutamyl-tRNA reductase [Pirellulaceae bacterium]